MFQIRVKRISFPLEEQQELKTRLVTEGFAFTTRVSHEFGKYKLGEVLLTPWDDLIIISFTKIIHDIQEHPFYNKLSHKQQLVLTLYHNMELLKFVKLQTF